MTSMLSFETRVSFMLSDEYGRKALNPGSPTTSEVLKRKFPFKTVLLLSIYRVGRLLREVSRMIFGLGYPAYSISVCP